MRLELFERLIRKLVGVLVVAGQIGLGQEEGQGALAFKFGQWDR